VSREPAPARVAHARVARRAGEPREVDRHRVRAPRVEREARAELDRAVGHRVAPRDGDRVRAGHGDAHEPRPVVVRQPRVAQGAQLARAEPGDHHRRPGRAARGVERDARRGGVARPARAAAREQRGGGQADR
jgi:hypothetical protein